MTLHNALTGTELHEPKNIAATTAGAADVGKVVVAKGDGTSEVRKLARAEVSDYFEHYGQLAVSNNSAGIAMTAAIDSTLEANSDYIKVTGIYDAIPHGESKGVTQGADTLTVAKSGVYKVSVWFNSQSSLNSTTVAAKFAMDGVISLERRPKSFLRTVGEFHNVSAFGFVALTAGTVVDLYIASSLTATITIEDLVFSLQLMRAT